MEKQPREQRRYALTLELPCACQVMDIRGADGLSTGTRRLYERTRALVPFLAHDVTVADYLEAIARRILTPGPERPKAWTEVLCPSGDGECSEDEAP